jgi:hypothetical protein
MTFLPMNHRMSQNDLGAKKKSLPILIKPPEPASSQDFLGLLLLESALAFHFSVSGFAHNPPGIEGQ